MSLPKTLPLTEIVTHIELKSLILEETPLVSPPAQPRLALPDRIAIVGNYLPRRCGIVTFTTDLCDAIHTEYGTTELLALPVNDTEEGYSYPARVRFELSEDNLASYRQAADFHNLAYDSSRDGWSVVITPRPFIDFDKLLDRCPPSDSESIALSNDFLATVRLA